jgi:hypothetical protein
MAQIIKHRRGSLESLSTVTGSLQKGEIVIASGSSNLTVTNGSSLVFAVPENGQVQATNRFLIGDAAPNVFAASTYNGMVKGVPYYASGSATLYLLGSGGNDAIDLTGNISNFSSSVATSINALSSSIGGGSIGNSVSLLSSQTGSYATTGSNVFIGDQTITGSITIKDESSEFKIEGNGFGETYIQTTTGNLLLHATNGGNPATVNVKGGNLTVDGTISGSIVGIGNVTAFSTSVDSRFSASTADITSLSASVASVTGDFSSSVATSFSASAASQTVLSQSVSASFASVAIEQSAQDDRLTTLESVSGSYALLSGSNVFLGTQTITGSLYITNDLIVQGSSSLQDVTASAVNIGTNQLNLNTATPAVRYAGVNVYDSGSSGVSASLQWDSLNDQWIFVHQESGSATVDSSILLYGPLSNGGLGTEATLAGNFLTKIENNGHGHHLTTSSIEDTGTNVIVHNSLGVSGSLIVNEAIVGTGSIFLQPDITDSRKLEIYNTAPTDVHIKSTGGLTFLGDDTNYVKIDDSLQTVTVVGVNGVFIETQLNVTGPISASAGFSGSIAGIGNVTAYSQSVSASLAEITANVGSGVGVSITNLNSFTSSIDTTIKTKLDADGVISGSSQVVLTSADNTSFDTSYVSENANYLYYTDTRVKDKLDSESVISSSAQVDITSTNGYTTFSGSISSSFSASAASQTTLSASVATDFSASAASQTTLSASVATDFSASNASITSLSASVASVTGDFSSSVATSFSASAASQTALSSSLAGRVATLEGTGTIQGVGQSDEVTFAKVTTTGDVVVGGDLVVQGNTVTLNTATLIVEDKLITLASGSTSSATADGAGFEVAGADVNFVYQHSTTSFTSSVALIAPAVTSSINLGSTAGNSKRIAFRNTNGNLDLVPTASVAGDLLQWDGTDFVMSNTIDGGSF